MLTARCGQMWPVAAVLHSRHETFHHQRDCPWTAQAKRRWQTGGCPGPVCVHGSAGAQPHHLFTYQWLPSARDSRARLLCQKPRASQSQKYSLSGPVRKNVQSLSKTNSCLLTDMSYQIPTVHKVKFQGLGTERRPGQTGPCTHRGYWLFWRRPFTC